MFCCPRYGFYYTLYNLLVKRFYKNILTIHKMFTFSPL
nr:MAG TPA: hypothetical protein [Podoviridae sp. ctJ6o53]